MIRSILSIIRASARPLVCALALAAASPQALAQITSDLPRSTVETISVSGAQRTHIEEFVSNWTERATNDDPQDNRRALEALTAPLHNRGVSVAFRQAYAQAVSPLLDQLESDGSVGDRLSALRIAGDLATPRAVSRVRDAMGDEDIGVRLFAVSRAGQIFETTRKHGTAITASDAQSLMTAISELGAQDGADEELLRASVRALAEGAALTSSDLGDTRSQAIITMAEIVGSRLQGLGINDDPTFVQSLALDAAGASTQAISNFSSTTTPQAAKAAVGLGGDIISVALRRVLGKTIEPVDQRDMTVRSVQAGETLLYFARRKAAELANGSTGGIVTTNFSEQLAAGEDRDFRNDASALLGPGSEIVTRFDFEADRFLR